MSANQEATTTGCDLMDRRPISTRFFHRHHNTKGRLLTNRKRCDGTRLKTVLFWPAFPGNPMGRAAARSSSDNLAVDRRPTPSRKSILAGRKRRYLTLFARAIQPCVDSPFAVRLWPFAAAPGEVKRTAGFRKSRRPVPTFPRKLNFRIGQLSATWRVSWNLLQVSPITAARGFPTDGYTPKSSHRARVPWRGCSRPNGAGHDMDCFLRLSASPQRE
jgi:hypothetical protein